MAQRGLSPAREGTDQAPGIAVCLGDPAGVGYEVGLDAVGRILRGDWSHRCGLLVIGDGRIVADLSRSLEVALPIETVKAPKVPVAGRVLLLDTSSAERAAVSMGSPNATAGLVALNALEAAIDCAKYGFVDAIVYTALDHRSLIAAGLPAREDSDFFSERFGCDGPRMDILVAGEHSSRVWIGRVTSHGPLASVPALVTKKKVVEGLLFLRDAMARAGVTDIHIAVPALRSHGPSGGPCPLELDVLPAAVREAQTLGVPASGPVATDTVFKTAFAGGYNGILSLYPDQGLIAAKTAAFDTAVMLLAGLPVPVVTTAHGSALDIAGRGVASSLATTAAILLAIELAAARERSPKGNGPKQGR
ncbi:MAG: hypothetical protein F9K44_09620 [Hyphomicrobiaceae bacterium]|nr:MAG: hypothetical protein F9K44_09620 [Hyphomicrobiaceae bacterium]